MSRRWTPTTLRPEQYNSIIRCLYSSSYGGLGLGSRTFSQPQWSVSTEPGELQASRGSCGISVGRSASSGCAAVVLLKNEDADSFFRSGLELSLDSPGIPLIYEAKSLDTLLSRVTFGTTTEFTIRRSDGGGDNPWNVYSFGTEFGHDK